MFFRQTLGVIAFSVTTAFAASVSAATMIVDDSVFGSETVIRDTTNNREFLRLDLTMGYGFTGISSEFGAGGDFAGWGVASESNMLDLGAAFGTGITPGSTDVGQISLAETLRDWFCPTGTCVNFSSTHTYARGLVTDLGYGGNQAAFSIGLRFNVDPNEVDFRLSGYDHAGTNEEVWLTRVAPVPVPAAGLLLLGGLFGLGAVGRKRRTA